MTTEQFLETLLVAVVGSGGVVGIMFKVAYRYLDRWLTQKELEDQERQKEKEERLRINDKIQHRQGRCFFWIYKAIVDGRHNGDLERAFKDLQEAEDEKKEIDQRILAKHDTTDF